METETKNLAGLLRHVLQKTRAVNGVCQEITHALNALHAAVEIEMSCAGKPVTVTSKLRAALHTVSGLLYLLCNKKIPLNSSNQNLLLAHAYKLHKALCCYLSEYYDAGIAFGRRFEIKDLPAVLSTVSDNLKNNSPEHEVLQILRSALQEALKTKPLSLNRWLWWACFAELTEGTTHSPFFMEQSLIKLNFNIPAFVDHLSANIFKQLQCADGLQEQLKLLSKELQKYTNLITCCHGYLSAKTSVKQYMISFLKFQFRLLSVQASYLPSKTIKLPKLNSALSVPQLALFIRLMVETKIINETSQLPLLKNIAAIVSTPKASVVSAESLRVNYYTPGLAAKNITKEYLSQMIRLLNSY